MTIRTKALLINIFFHIVVLGFVVKPLLYPDMINEYWIALVAMIFLMRPIVGYFFGWEMTLKGTVPADASKYTRLSVLIVIVICYSLMLLGWLGVIDISPKA